MYQTLTHVESSSTKTGCIECVIETVDDSRTWNRCSNKETTQGFLIYERSCNVVCKQFKYTVLWLTAWGNNYSVRNKTILELCCLQIDAQDIDIAVHTDTYGINMSASKEPFQVVQLVHGTCDFTVTILYCELNIFNKIVFNVRVILEFFTMS